MPHHDRRSADYSATEDTTISSRSAANVTCRYVLPVTYGTRSESSATPDAAIDRSAPVESPSRWLIVGYVFAAILALGPLARMTGVVTSWFGAPAQ